VSDVDSKQEYQKSDSNHTKEIDLLTYVKLYDDEGNLLLGPHINHLKGIQWHTDINECQERINKVLNSSNGAKEYILKNVTDRIWPT